MNSEDKTCTKCGGLNRRDTDSLVCNNCGHRKWDYVAPVVSGVPPKEGEPRRVWDPVEKTATHHIVVKLFNSIIAQRAAGVSWNTIAQLLTQSGHRCQEKTLQKHFLLEQGKREKATEQQT